MRKLKPILFTIAEMVMVAIGTYLFSSYIIIWGNVPSSSMSPTIMPGDVVIANGLAYINSAPQRGDIIIFDRYIGDQKESVVKRVIGVPGDDVMFIEGTIYINGQRIKEKYLSDDTYSDCAYDFFEIPEEQYFVLGDNRTNSFDSRYWSYPYVKKEDIQGKLLHIINTSYFYSRKSIIDYLEHFHY